jgi:hypothetical protein
LLKSYQPAELPNFTLQPHLQTIRSCFSADSLEGVLSSLEKEGSAFSQEQLKTIEKMVKELATDFRRAIRGFFILDDFLREWYQYEVQELCFPTSFVALFI